MIEYRFATTDDMDALIDVRIEFLLDAGVIENQNQIEPTKISTRAYLMESLQNDTFAACIAMDGSKIIATSGIAFYRLLPHPHQPEGNVAYINNMYTRPSHRGQGIASKVFSLTMDEAKKRGCNKVLLDATPMGKPIYAKYGFVEFDDTMVYYISK